MLRLAVISAATLACALDVYVVPHSHCDVGWLYTADRYFYNGTHKTGSGVQTVSRSAPPTARAL